MVILISYKELSITKEEVNALTTCIDRGSPKGMYMTLDTYSHVLPNIQEEAANKMDDFLGRHLFLC